MVNCGVSRLHLPRAVPAVSGSYVNWRPTFKLIAGDVDDDTITLNPGMGASVLFSTHIINLEA